MRRALRDDSAQDAFEYLLATGVVVVAVYTAMLVFNQLSPLVVGHSCPSVDTASVPAATEGSCINESP